jgi:hypothetical protein
LAGSNENAGGAAPDAVADPDAPKEKLGGLVVASSGFFVAAGAKLKVLAPVPGISAVGLAGSNENAGGAAPADAFADPDGAKEKADGFFVADGADVPKLKVLAPAPGASAAGLAGSNENAGRAAPAGAVADPDGAPKEKTGGLVAVSSGFVVAAGADALKLKALVPAPGGAPKLKEADPPAAGTGVEVVDVVGFVAVPKPCEA